MNVKTKDIFSLVSGTVFYEEDWDCVYIFCGKTADEDDVFVIPLAWEGQTESQGKRRLGLREMDQTSKDSKIWVIPGEEELADMQESLSIGVYSLRELKKASILSPP